MAYSIEDLADDLKATQKDLGPPRFTEIATDLQEHHALSQILANKRRSIESGYAIQRNLMVDQSGAAKHVKLFEVDDVNFGDVLQQITVPWRHTTTNYVYEYREMLMNRSAARIVDIVQVRRIDAMISLAEKLENALWHTIPDDGETPFGFQYWITYNATTGFNGGNHTNFSSGPGGLSATTYPRWKNYTYKYTDVTKADLIAGWRRAYRKCNFKPAVKGIPSYEQGGPRYANYVNDATIAAIEDLGESQNENLGHDIASMDGQMVFRRTPIYWVPFLDAYSTSDPVYMVDWSVFYPVFLRGDYLRQTGPDKQDGAHNNLVTFIDMTWNMLCTNRRRLALLAKADPASGI